MSENFALRVDNLSAFYGIPKTEKHCGVLENISFILEKQELLCLCGPNGSGKSTLLSVLANLKDNGISFSKNSVFIAGEENSIENLKRKQIAKKLCLMTQNESCQWNYSVRDFIKFGRFVYNDENSEYASSLVDKVILDLDLSGIAEKYVNSISGGEFQKVRIARTLVQETPILLLDEPVANLDYEYQFKLLQFIKDLCKNDGKSVIVSIHDLNVASVFADRILILGKAENQFQENYIGKPEEIFETSVLKKIFRTEMQTFIHPEYKVPQVYLK